MSLLSICQAVAQQVPLAAPTSIIGNGDETAILLLALANKAGEELARRPDQGWVDMVREYDFTTAATASLSGTITNSGLNGGAVISGLTLGGATNLLLWSQQFSITPWAANNSSIAANAATAPDGSLTANHLTESATTAGHNVTQSVNVTGGTFYVFSGYFKAAERGFGFLAQTGASFPTTSISINLATGAVSAGTGTPLNAMCVPVGNGWYRASFCLAATATGSSIFQMNVSADGIWANRSYAGDGSSGIYIWGAQLEVGTSGASSAPTAYVQSMGTQGSRAGLVASSGWIAFGTGVQNNSLVTAVTNADPNSTVTLSLPATQTGSGQFVFGQSDYALPSDYKSPVDNTFWDRSRFWSMRGPQSPQQWQLYKSSVIGRASIQRRFRFRRSATGGVVLSIDPVPTDNASQLVFEYVSTGWCQSISGTPQTSWQADTDVGVVDEYLMQLSLLWRVLRRKGMSYSEELDEYEREVNKAMSKDGGAAILDLTPNDSLSIIGPWNLPETNFGNAISN